MTRNFALIGAAGYVAPRHLQAVQEVGGTLVAAVDPHDSVGVLDRYFPGARFFTEIERFDRHLEKLRHSGSERRVDYVSICSPNYLHDAHVRLALRLKADAICEKPLVLSPWNVDQLREIEKENDRRVHVVLQLRLLDALKALKKKIDASQGPHDVCLSYVTARGPWYDVSWKGKPEQSGGVAMNIGIHFFDLMLWFFGGMESTTLHLSQQDKMAGVLQLEKARVRWFLSVDRGDLPTEILEAGKTAYRSITIDGEELEFSPGFTNLHTEVYRDVLDGGGFGLDDARPAIDAVYQTRQNPLATPDRDAHPWLKK